MIRHHLAWNMYFQCHSDLAHERGTTRCVRTPALPENKNPLLTALSDFSTLLHPFLLSESAHVSLSWALPQAFASWAILTLVALVGAYLSNESVTCSSYKSKSGVPPFRVVVCRCFRLALYAGLLLCENGSKMAHLLQGGVLTPLTFHRLHFGAGPSFRVTGPVLFHDASTMHFLRSHSSQLADVATSDITSKGLHLTSTIQLSRYCYLAAHPSHCCDFGPTGRTGTETSVPQLNMHQEVRVRSGESSCLRARAFHPPFENRGLSSPFSVTLQDSSPPSVVRKRQTRVVAGGEKSGTR